MRKAITSVAAVAILTVAGVSGAHALSFGDISPNFSRRSSSSTSSGRDSISRSFNRKNSPDISRSKNVNSGNVQSGGNKQGEVRDIGHGTAKKARVAGDWKNDGVIGHSMSTGGISLGDNVNTGHTYTGTDALNTMNEASRIQANKEIELKRLDTSVSKYRSVR